MFLIVLIKFWAIMIASDVLAVCKVFKIVEKDKAFKKKIIPDLTFLYNLNQINFIFKENLLL